MEQVWIGIQWGISLAIPAMLWAWWKEPDRLEQIAVQITIIALLFGTLSFLLNIAYSEGRTTQWVADYSAVRDANRKQNAEAAKVVDAVWHDENLSLTASRKLSDIAYRESVSLDTNSSPFIPWNICGLFGALAFVAWFTASVKPPAPVRGNLKPNDSHSAADKRDEE